MGKFNKKVETPKTLTTNVAGGPAYKETNELALTSMLLTSFVNDEFYKSGNDTLKDLKSLIKKVDPEFTAKAAIYARDKFGMRSITHALAGELTSELKGSEVAKNFYDKVVVRVDDMTEILSYYLMYKTDKENPKFPNSLKKGFAKAFDKFDNYQIAKYQGKNKDIKLVDLVNIVHPVPNDKNKESLRLLVRDELKNTDTWEAKLSNAGQNAEDSEDLAKLKSDVWVDLISSRKIGYFALLRNLRNILTQSPEIVDAACELLVDSKMIKKSRVLPFRFLKAYEEIYKLSGNSNTRKVLGALNNALEISVNNVPKLEGETIVVVDTSSSMRGRASEIASLFGAILAKANNCDIMTFERNAQYMNYNPGDSIMTIRDSFAYNGGGTNFNSIFRTLNKAYDNIIILSDMQGWLSVYTPKAECDEYKKRFNANPHIYSWDLAGLGTLQLPQNQVYCLAGFSDKVFDIMAMLKEDRNALINEIKSIEL